MDIAVIIPVWNRPGLVLDALENVAGQSRPPNRLIVVDDGSEDESPEVVERWIRERGSALDAMLVRQAHANLPTARNRGAAEAPDADIYCFLDCDDLWPPDFLARVEDAFRTNPSAFAFAGDFKIVDYADGSNTLVDTRGLETDGLEHVLRVGTALASCSAFPAAAFHSLEGFDSDQSWGEDLEFSLRLSARGRWVHLPGEPVTIRHRLADQRGEQASLAYSIRNPQREEALMVTRFLFEQNGLRFVEDRVWRRRLVFLWFRAGQHDFRDGEFGEAQSCFVCAVRLWPRARFRLWRLRARVRRLLAGQPSVEPRIPAHVRPTGWFTRLGRRLARSARHRVFDWRARRGRPYGDADLPKATVILLSFKRPQNMDRIVRICLAARFVERVIVSNNNPEVDLRDWIGIDSDRLQLIAQPKPTPPGVRVSLARKAGGRHFISIDDDVFLSPGQLHRLYRAYLSDPSVPHGFHGQCWEEAEREGGLGGVVLGDKRVDVLNRAYFFSESQLTEFERLAALLHLGPPEAIRNGEDVLLSFCGERRPRIHGIGPVLECPTSDRAGIAVWREPGFQKTRVQLFQSLRTLKPLDADPV